MIEDHRNSKNTDQRTLRAQIFSPNRITKIQTHPRQAKPINKSKKFSLILKS